MMVAPLIHQVLSLVFAAVAAPAEVRNVLEVALQMLPPHQQLAAAKLPVDSIPAQAAAAAAPGSNTRQSMQQQQQHGLQGSGSLPPLAQGNGIAAATLNGMEPLGRSARAELFVVGRVVMSD
jgi:hypothetical protein